MINKITFLIITKNEKSNPKYYVLNNIIIVNNKGYFTKQEHITIFL